MEDRSVSVYELVGGQSYFDELVERFYGHVEEMPALRRLYPDDLGPGKRALALFLGQYWGGPARYSAEKGHPRLRMRHAPFPIDEAARRAWLDAMQRAVADTSPPEVVRGLLLEYFEMASAAMVNRGGATMDR
jgi:hemoglobin